MKKLLFVITQFYKGGAEVALLNLFKQLSPEEYEIDFLIYDQIILRDAQSLIPLIPKWINVCNASEREGKLAIIKKVWYKIYYKITRQQLYRRTAYEFVRGKIYDVAFSYGEWFSPQFVAEKVNARKKMVWIHADIDKASYINKKVLFGYNNYIDGYIFVSKESKNSAEKVFPVLIGKSHVVHNMCDDYKIRKLGQEPLDEDFNAKTWLLSVANLREEKNYPRMIESMKCLINLGINIKWVCIGSTANAFLLNKINSLLAKYHMESNFFLLGAKENPYKYMSKANAVIVLSDYESWSMVITEAKLLGIPVISTKTSGAIEQIEDGKNGILVSFDPEQIAQSIKEFLLNPEISCVIRSQLKNFSTQQGALEEFFLILEE